MNQRIEGFMFSDSDWNDIQCALEIAGEQYEKDAATNAGQPRIAAQFREQAQRAFDLIDRLPPNI